MPQLRVTNASGSVPTVDQFGIGDVVVNTYDGKAYIKKLQGTTQTVLEIGSSITPTSASYALSSSFAVSSSIAVSSSFATTASYAVNHAIITSSYICDGILSTNQIFATASDAIIAFVDYLDPNGWLTANQFKPTISGYYSVSFGAWLQNAGISSNQVNIQMRKNGNSMIINQQPLNNGTGISLGGSRIIQMNGTTDYIDWTVFQGAGSSANGTLLQGTVNGSGTWFSAFLLTQ